MFALFFLERLYAPLATHHQALDRLGSISRLSPSPRAGTPSSRSPAPSQTSSSRLSSQHRPLRSVSSQISSPAHDHGRSGSETERESTHHSYSNTSHSSHSSSSSAPSHRHSASMSSTQTPSPATPHNHSPFTRLRHISAPGSPNKVRITATVSTPSSSNPTYSPSKRRHRISIASASSLQLGDFNEEDDEPDGAGPIPQGGRSSRTARDRPRERTLSERDMITQSALAAVANSRRSPVNGRRRGALPREFRSDLDADEGPARPVPTTTSATSTLPGSTDGRRSVTGRFVDGDERSSPELDRRQGWKVRLGSLFEFNICVPSSMVLPIS